MLHVRVELIKTNIYLFTQKKGNIVRLKFIIRLITTCILNNSYVSVKSLNFKIIIDQSLNMFILL